MVSINVDEVIDTSRFNRFHLGLLLWCGFVVLFDSYDLVAYSSALPGLTEEWGLSPIEAGTIGSCGFIGMMLGAVVLGVLADRFGRRKVLVASIVLLSVFMFLCAFAPGPVSFAVLRLLGGFGVGGVMPNVLAFLADYVPARLRNTATGIVLCCFSLGGILAPVLGLTLVPSAGWRSLYWVAAIPVLALPFMVRYFREPPGRLLADGRTGELRAVFAQVTGRDAPFGAVFTANMREYRGRFPAVELFRDRRAQATMMIALAFFMCLLLINGLSIWLPSFMVAAGYAFGSGFAFLILLNAGAIAGTLILGRAADVWGTKRVLIPMFVVSAISLSLLGFTKDFGPLACLVLIAGACTMGAQNIAYSFVSQYYPSAVRATGVGFASAIGRLGAIAGPTYGGILLSLSLPAPMNFVCFAVPGLIAAIAFGFVRTRNTTGDPTATAADPPTAVAEQRSRKGT